MSVPLASTSSSSPAFGISRTATAMFMVPTVTATRAVPSSGVLYLRTGIRSSHADHSGASGRWQDGSEAARLT